MIFNMGGRVNPAKKMPAFTYSGTYRLIDEGLTETAQNWRIEFLTSGTLKFNKLASGNTGIDVFCVGGGGGAPRYCGGGGGGYTKTQKGVSVEVCTPYDIVIGAGGASKTDHTNGGDGGTTQAFGVEALGGKGAIWADIREGDESKIYAYRVGADGGSGGGGYEGNGGTNGADGEAGDANYGGKGQGTTTRAFGASTGTAYGAGGGGSGKGANAAANTGGGAGSGCSSGSGIVIIRNKR